MNIFAHKNLFPLLNIFLGAAFSRVELPGQRVRSFYVPLSPLPVYSQSGDTIFQNENKYGIYMREITLYIKINLIQGFWLIM